MRTERHYASLHTVSRQLRSFTRSQSTTAMYVRFSGWIPDRKVISLQPDLQRMREGIEMTPLTDNGASRTVADVFCLIDNWRHLPAYRLEARSAPFFALFLRDVLSRRLNVDLHPIVIPEFPLRAGTLYGKEQLDEMRAEKKRAARDNQSYNVDYVAFSRDRQTAFLVELKTDMSMISRAQEKYLCLARERKLGPLVSGIVEICEKSKKRRKYVHLLHHLANLGLVSMDEREALYKATFPTPQSGWKEVFKSVRATVDGKLQSTRIVYIQPRKSKPKKDLEYIYFDEVADIVQPLGDLGRIFADYLREWRCDPGKLEPRDMGVAS